MIRFDPKFFHKVKFSGNQIDRLLQNALRDLSIAHTDSIPEVKFTYSYQALIKLGLALLAKVGSVRVKSMPGHHVKILSKMSEILNDPDVMDLGNAMRQKRNLDLYEGGQVISEKEAKDYLEFVNGVIQKVKKTAL